MASPDTFDPKTYLPFEEGLEVEKILSTFPAIDTNVDGLKISQGLENIAQVMDRGTLIRSAYQPDLGAILHSRHQYHWHTGYVPPSPWRLPTSVPGWPKYLAQKMMWFLPLSISGSDWKAWEKRGIESLYHCRIFWIGIRAHEPALPRSGGAICSASQRDGTGSVQQPLQAF
jgi:hypothetical protein